MSSSSPQPTGPSNTEDVITPPSLASEWRTPTSNSGNVDVRRSVSRGRRPLSVVHSQEDPSRVDRPSNDQIASAGDILPTNSHSASPNVAQNLESAWGVGPTSMSDVSHSWSRAG